MAKPLGTRLMREIVAERGGAVHHSTRHHWVKSDPNGAAQVKVEAAVALPARRPKSGVCPPASSVATEPPNGPAARARISVLCGALISIPHIGTTPLVAENQIGRKDNQAVPKAD